MNILRMINIINLIINYINMEMSEVFWTGFYTAVMACFIGTVNVLYKSKCKQIKCCGCEVIRDVEVELKEDMRQSVDV